MSPRAEALLGWSGLAAAVVIAAIAVALGWLASLRRVREVALHKRGVTIALLLGWMWLGWHLFAR